MSRVNISDLNIKLSATGDGLKTGIDQGIRNIRRLANEAEQTNNRITDFIKGSAFAAASVGALAIFDKIKDTAFNFTVDSIGLAADLEASTLQFTTILKDAEAAKNLIKDIQGFANATPFESKELVDASKQLLAYGFGAESLLPTLRSLGDIAAASGSDINDLAQIYGRAFAENRIQGEELNRLSDRAIPIFELLGKQFGKNAAEIRKMGAEGKLTFADLQKAFADLTSAGGQFEGATERLSESVNGKLSTLADSVDELKRKFGEELSPATREAIDLLIEAASAAADLGDSLGTISSLTIDGLAQSIRSLRVALPFVSVGIKKMLADLGLIDRTEVKKALSEALVEVNRITSGVSNAPKQPGIKSLIVPDAPKAAEAAKEELEKIDDAANKATESIRKTFKALDTNPALTKGSQEQLLASFKYRYGSDGENTETKQQAQVRVAVANARAAAAQAPAIAAQRDEAIREFRIKGDPVNKAASSPEKKDDSAAKEVSKLQQEITKQSVMDRALLSRIATAVEKPKQPIRIKVFRA